MMTKNKIAQLAHCSYPLARETDQHGLFKLPENLSSVNWSALNSFRISDFNDVSLADLSNPEVLDVARVIANSFVKNEASNRHVKIPRSFPESLSGTHHDEYGDSAFGEWTAENLFQWLIRLAFLTKPADKSEVIRKNQDVLELSLAVKDKAGHMLAGVLCQTLSAEETSMRTDAYLSSIFKLYAVNLEFVFSQEHEAITALTQKYPDFEEALKNKKVASMLMLAKEDRFPKENALELFIRAVELLQQKGYKYIAISGSNQWTGAACELLNATRVHYKAFRDSQRVAISTHASDDEMHSVDGYLSDKDSGILFYLIKL